MADEEFADGVLRDPREMDADSINAVLREEDVALMFVTDDYAIHELYYSDGRITFFKGGTYGYDESTSHQMLRDVATEDGPSKFVPQNRLLTERKDLCNGKWETAAQWADTSEVTA